jgi:hypothetical protein
MLLELSEVAEIMPFRDCEVFQMADIMPFTCLIFELAFLEWLRQCPSCLKSCHVHDIALPTLWIRWRPSGAEIKVAHGAEMFVDSSAQGLRMATPSKMDLMGGSRMINLKKSSSTTGLKKSMLQVDLQKISNKINLLLKTFPRKSHLWSKTELHQTKK